ncbi:hypothetical protein D3C80_1704690 [compost metagenome]
MRRPSLTALLNSGFTRRCLFSMHSDCAMMTLGPLMSVVSASSIVARTLATSYVRSSVRTHFTPTPRTAWSMGLLVDRSGLSARDDRMSCPPVAEA